MLYDKAPSSFIFYELKLIAGKRRKKIVKQENGIIARSQARSKLGPGFGSKLSFYFEVLVRRNEFTIIGEYK